MTYRYTYSVGGLSYSVSSGEGVNLSPPPAKCLPFVSSPGEAPGGEDIRILVETGSMPDLSGREKIFDTDEAWAMYRRAGEYLLVLKSLVSGEEPIWAAEFHPEGNQVLLHGGRSLERMESGRCEVGNPVCYPLDQILTMYFLSRRKGAIVHAAGVMGEGGLCLFPGRSGAGKSTIARQLAGRKGWTVLSDDRIILREGGGAVRAFGTPWPGEAGIAVSARADLRGIFFLRQGREVTVREITPRQAFEKLMPVVSVPWYDERYMVAVLSFCEAVTETVPAYDLTFSLDGAAAEVIRNILV